MLAFSLSRTWGAQKLRRLSELERHVVVVHISDPGVRQAYAELSTLAQSSGWSMFHGKNDLWVGAAAHAADAHLLTMDTDFLPLRGRAGWRSLFWTTKPGFLARSSFQPGSLPRHACRVSSPPPPRADCTSRPLDPDGISEAASTVPERLLTLVLKLLLGNG